MSTTSPHRLDGKHILVFAATGSIGSVTARHLASEGAHVHLSGRDADAVSRLREEIEQAGGAASADVVDAADERSVTEYVDRIAADGRGPVEFLLRETDIQPNDPVMDDVRRRNQHDEDPIVAKVDEFDMLQAVAGQAGRDHDAYII